MGRHSEVEKDMNPKDKHADWLLKPTANELADYLDNNVEAMIMSEQRHIDKAATMLRQQQAEIEALKQIIDANNLNQNIGQFVKPTNEPVAWMNKIATSWVTTTPDEFKDEWIPLYTHPVKELTDEEIRHIQAICHLKDVGYDGFIMRFARTILLKAQEK